MKTLSVVAMLPALLLVTPAEANGKARGATVSGQVVRVYEPRPAPPEPLLALSLLGHGLIISDSLDIDLFDIEERRRQQFRGRVIERRIVRERRRR